MGIIIKQTIKGTAWTYLGVIIGFVTTAFLFPNYLKPEVIGLFSLLISYSTLVGRISLLGLPGVTNRLFTYFRSKKNANNGFLTIALIFHIIGILVLLSAFFIAKPYLIKSNIENSPLFVDYLYLLIPMTIAAMVFIFLDSYNKVLYDAVFGTFLQEFLQRFLIFAVTIVFIIDLINLQQLIIAYAIVVSIKALIILILLIIKKELKFSLPDKNVSNKKMKKEILNVAIYSLVGGLGSMIAFKIDRIIINQMLDLRNTGVYTIAFYFGSLIALPSRSLLKISGTVIADSWRKNDIKLINQIYDKGCLNQLIISGFLFLGVWANIDNILNILGEEYQDAKWVIFFIGIGYLFDMLTGPNGQIINFSKYYRVNLIFVAILIGMVTLLMYLLIPIWGIVGAAIAIASSLMLNNLMRFLFLYYKYKMQPFKLKFIVIIGFFIALYLIQSLIPQMNLILDIFIRSFLISIVTFVLLLIYPVSEDINKILKSLLNSFIDRTR